MQRSINRVALVAVVVLCGTPARFPPTIQFGKVAAESLVWDDGAAGVTAGSEPPRVVAKIEDAALDEMLRDPKGQLQHWTAVPDLVVLTTVMRYHAEATNEYVATSDVVSADDTNRLVADLTLALRQLTNGALNDFATINYETVPVDSSVTILRPKQIVVGRYEGLRGLAHTIGFGGRQARRDGAIVGAAVMLDNEFDRTSGMRRLLRTHELGHALGFNHVKSRVSIMNERIGPEMTDVDRQIATLAFQRPSPGPTEY
jgi:predicted Zn-dependent protease